MGLKFRSPTINLTISDFPRFAQYFKLYMKAELVEVESEERCPVGELISEDVEPMRIRFDHYETFEEAKTKWEDRKKRINYSNIYYLMESYNAWESDKLQRFLSLPESLNKMAIYHHHFEGEKGIKGIQYIGCETGTKESPVWAQVLEYKKNTGRRWLDDFDYVSFLNNRK